MLADAETFRALRVPRYPFLLATGWVWGLSRWGVGFLGGYLARELSGSPRMIQLTGVALWAPLLIGGVAGGVIADRLDRRVAIVVQLATVAVLATGLGAVDLAGRLELWMVYPFLVVVGTGWVIDMTCRRTIVYELVGPGTIDNAMALESVSSASSLAAGALVGGGAIRAVGVGPAFLVVAALMVVALGLFLAVPVPRSGPAMPVPAPTAGPTSGPSAGPTAGLSAGPGNGPVAAIGQGLALVRSEPALVSVLGVTAVVNFFYFSFTPLVQRFGQLLDADAFATGVLVSMTGFGMMIGSGLVAHFQFRRRGLVYLIGALGAMVVLVPFTRSTSFPISMVFLLLSGVGIGLFASTQGTLVLTAVGDEVRGRAMGLLSTAIGVLPAGMIALGELAEVWGARDAVLASIVTGAAVCVIWVTRWRQVVTLTA